MTEITTTTQELERVLDEAQMEGEFKQSLIKAFTPFVTQAKEWKSEAESIVVTDEADTEGMKRARELRLKVKGVRCDSENARKRYKQGFLNGGRAVDGLHNIIEALTKPTEEHLELQEKFAELQEQKRKEERKSSRIIELQQYEVDPQGYDLVNMTEENYKNLVNMSKMAYDKRKEDEAKAEKDRIEQEAKEREEQERIRKENEDLRKKNEIIEKIQSIDSLDELRKFITSEPFTPDIIAIANNRVIELQEKQDAIIETERLRKEKEDAERKAKSAEKAKKASEDAHQRWIKQQEDQKEKDRKEKEKAEWEEKQAKKKAEREANRAPDKDKLNKLADAIDAIVFPTCKTEEGVEILRQTTVMISKLTKYIRENADKSV